MQCALRFNVNTFGLSPTLPAFAFSGNEAVVQCAQNPASVSKTPPSLSIEAALRDNTSGVVVYFTTALPFEVLFAEGGPMESNAFIAAWRATTGEGERESTVAGLAGADVATVTRKLAAKNVFFVAKRPVAPDQVCGAAAAAAAGGCGCFCVCAFCFFARCLLACGVRARARVCGLSLAQPHTLLFAAQEVAYFSVMTTARLGIMAELTFKAGFPACKMCIKSSSPLVVQFAAEAIERIIRSA